MTDPFRDGGARHLTRGPLLPAAPVSEGLHATCVGRLLVAH